jgi:hypothetical protein
LKHLSVLQKGPFFILEHFLENYTFFLISLWWLTSCLSKLVLVKTISSRGSPWRVSIPLSLLLTTFHTSSPLFPHLLVFQAYWPQEGIIPHFMGIRGYNPKGIIANIVKVKIHNLSFYMLTLRSWEKWNVSL